MNASASLISNTSPAFHCIRVSQKTKPRFLKKKLKIGCVYCTMPRELVHAQEQSTCAALFQSFDCATVPTGLSFCFFSVAREKERMVSREASCGFHSQEPPSTTRVVPADSHHNKRTHKTISQFGLSKEDEIALALC
jgi:hypothetical protein